MLCSPLRILTLVASEVTKALVGKAAETMTALAQFSNFFGEVIEVKEVEVKACYPCKGSGKVALAGIAGEHKCIICGGRGVIIAGGVFDREGEFTVRNAKLI